MEPSIEILFDNPTAIYFPGQAITGRVRVNVYNPISCYAIGVTFHGFADVSWSEEQYTGTGNERKKETVKISSNEQYYYMQYKLWGDDNIPSTLYTGTNDYNFTFQLPPNIPSSFEAKIGQVRHICSAKLGLMRAKPKFCMRPISVNSICDLNLHPNAKIPIVKDKVKELGCLCCIDGTIAVNLNIERSGYVPGENIMVNAQCTNDSTRAIKKSSIKLIQNIKFKAQGKNKCENNVISKLEHPESQPGDDDTWINVPFTVPPLPSDLKHCTLIETSYTLQFNMVPKGPSFTLTLESPIHIGTVPLQQTFSNFAPYTQSAVNTNDFPPPYESHNFPNAPPQPSAPYPNAPTAPYPLPAGATAPAPPQAGGNYGFNFPAVQQYPGLPLPATEDSFLGFTIIKHEVEAGHTQENTQWAPKYLTYNLANQPVQQGHGTFMPGANTQNMQDTAQLIH